MFQVPKTVDTSLNSNEHGIPEKRFGALIHQSCGQMVTIGINRTILLSCSSSIITNYQYQITNFTIGTSSYIMILPYFLINFPLLSSSSYPLRVPSPGTIAVVAFTATGRPPGSIGNGGIPTNSSWSCWFSVGFLLVFLLFFSCFFMFLRPKMPGSRMTFSAPHSRDLDELPELQPQLRWQRTSAHEKTCAPAENEAVGIICLFLFLSMSSVVPFFLIIVSLCLCLCLSLSLSPSPSDPVCLSLTEERDNGHNISIYILLSSSCQIEAPIENQQLNAKSVKTMEQLVSGVSTMMLKSHHDWLTACEAFSN